MTRELDQIRRQSGHKPPAHPLVALGIFILTIILAAVAAASDGSHTALAPLPCAVSADHTLAAGANDAIAFVRNAFDTAGFRPRWQTETWGTPHAWLHIAADLLIAASYGVIGAALWHIYRLRRAPRFPGSFVSLASSLLPVAKPTSSTDSCSGGPPIAWPPWS